MEYFSRHEATPSARYGAISAEARDPCIILGVTNSILICKLFQCLHWQQINSNLKGCCSIISLIGFNLYFQLYPCHDVITSMRRCVVKVLLLSTSIESHISVKLLFAGFWCLFDVTIALYITCIRSVITSTVCYGVVIMLSSKYLVLQARDFMKWKVKWRIQSRITSLKACEADVTSMIRASNCNPIMLRLAWSDAGSASSPHLCRHF